MLQRLHLLALTLLLAEGLAAQLAFATVTSAGENERVSAPRPYQQAIARGPQGTSFVLVHRSSTAVQGAGSDLEIWSSAGGRDWQQLASAPTTGDGLGCIVAEDKRPRLHLLWNARDGAEWSSVFHAVYDLQADAWLRPPTCLARATGPDDQYFANDLCLTGDRLVASVGAHRSPKTAGFTSWASCLHILRDLDAAEWSAPKSLHSGSAAISANLASFDGILHSAFRTYAAGDHCIATRRWNVNEGQFAADVARVAPLKGESRRHTNQGLIAIDQRGHRYVLTAIGTTTETDGRIIVSHAPVSSAAEGSETWSALTVDEDPPIRGGNVTILHLALARGPGNQMLAFYSKVSEQHAHLHLQVLEQGALVGKPRRIAAGMPGAFEQLSGVREAKRVAGVQLVITSNARTAPTANTPNEVRVYGFLR